MLWKSGAALPTCAIAMVFDHGSFAPDSRMRIVLKMQVKDGVICTLFYRAHDA
jgi:hypothetical protein